MITGYPFRMPHSASPIPVFPEVGSIMVIPGLSFPSFSATSIIFFAILSLMEPPGFKNSAFAKILSPVVCFKLISGVLPIKSKIFSVYIYATLYYVLIIYLLFCNLNRFSLPFFGKLLFVFLIFLTAHLRKLNFCLFVNVLKGIFVNLADNL